MTSSYILQIAFFVVLLIFLIYGYLKNRSGNHSSVSSIFIWVGIFAILIIIYAFRFELHSFKDRLLAVLIPSYSWTNDKGQLVLARNQDSHFYLTATTRNNKPIKFLVDTGASNIALTREDAVKLGFNIKDLKYTQRYSTANGISYAAPVRIDQLTIGDKIFYNIEAHITSGGLDISLLGMSLIGNFSDFKITRDLLILSY